jgi:hypothetical protein
MVSMIPFHSSRLIPDCSGINHFMTRRTTTDQRIDRYLSGHTGVINRIDNGSLLECPLTWKRNVTYGASVAGAQDEGTAASPKLYHHGGYCNRQICDCLLTRTNPRTLNPLIPKPKSLPLHSGHRRAIYVIKANGGSGDKNAAPLLVHCRTLAHNRKTGERNTKCVI